MDPAIKSNLEKENRISLFKTFLFRPSVSQLQYSNADLNIHKTMKLRVKRNYAFINDILE